MAEHVAVLESMLETPGFHQLEAKEREAIAAAIDAMSQPVAEAVPSSDYQRGFRDGYERRHMEVLGALV